MRFLRLLLIAILLILPSFSLAAQTPKEITVVQLKEEIQKLQAVDRDENTSAEIRELNRIFLKKRRIQLQDLLQKNVEGLKKYLASLDASLSPEEKLIVQNTITNAEKELQAVTEEIQGRSSGVIANTASAPDSNAAAGVGSATVESGNGNGNGNGNGHSNGGNVPVVSSPSVATANTAVSQPVVQPQGSTSVNAVLNARIKEKIDTLSRSRVEQTDNTNQTDVPSLSGSSSSLVDQSSASDLVGLATNFAGLSASSNGDQEEPSSIAVTASAYSLLAAIKRVDPLNSVFYDKHRNWRKFSVTLGYDDEDQPDGTKQRAKIFGAKFMFIDRRDPTLTRNTEYIDNISDKLEAASKQFGDLSLRINFYVFSLDSVKRDIVHSGFKAFLDKKKPEAELALQQANARLAALSIDSPDKTKAQTDVAEKQATVDRIERMRADPLGGFALGPNFLPTGWSREELEYQVEFANQYLGTNFRQMLGEEVSKAIDEFIDLQLTEPQLLAFKNLDESARQALEEIRQAPQFSLAFTTKQRRIGIDEYLGSLIFDYGMADRLFLTLNGSYSYNDSKLIGGDIRGFKFGGQLRFQLNGENLLGKKPLFFDVSTQGSWMNNVDAIYKAQGKLTIPIADGIDFPVSVTWANRTSLIDEKEVRGQFGFTLDTARLIRMFVFR